MADYLNFKEIRSYKVNDNLELAHYDCMKEVHTADDGSNYLFNLKYENISILQVIRTVSRKERTLRVCETLVQIRKRKKYL